MKVKFIPKKQRQAIKEQKQQQRVVRIESSKQQVLNQQTSNGMITHSNNKQMNGKKEIDERQRSRDDIKKIEWGQQQLKEMKQNKMKYLGLVKKQYSNRTKHNYKGKLNFQWANTDDTSMNNNRINYNVQGQKIDPIESQKMRKWCDKKYHEMTDRDWRIFREDNQIYVKSGSKVPYPFRQWNQLRQVDQTIIRNLEKLDFKLPKPIQMQAISIGLAYKDLIAIAPTGQGKTLAYLLPAINFMLKQPKLDALNSEKGPYCLVMVPSRDLALQIEQELNKFIKGTHIKALTTVGGKQIQFQSLEISKGIQILIGTPGRIKELIVQHYISFQRCSWVVIDQADKMITQNLVEQLDYILGSLGSQGEIPNEYGGFCHVTQLFSATMLPQIQKLCKKYLRSGISTYITIGQPGGGKKQIHQHVELIDESSKNERLGKILRQLQGPIIIFVNTRQECKCLCTLINKRWNRTINYYHGGRNQEERQKIIYEFKRNRFQILIATDLAGRGLDIKNINAVINYDCPKNISEFIHRSGRTGRQGMKGKVFTLLINSDEHIFYDLRIFLENNQFIVPEKMKQHPSSHFKLGTLLNVPKSKQIVYTN